MLSLPPYQHSLTEKETEKLGKMTQPWHMWLTNIFPFWQRAQNVGSYDYEVPTNGFSYQAPDYVEELVLDPAGGLTTGTVALPLNPTDGLVFTILSSKTITTFSVTSTTTIVGTAVTSLIASTAISYRYRASNTTWYRRQ